MFARDAWLWKNGTRWVVGYQIRPIKANDPNSNSPSIGGYIAASYDVVSLTMGAYSTQGTDKKGPWFFFSRQD